MRILVTGSREFTDKLLIVEALLPYAKQYGQAATVVHGFADGADLIANETAIFLGMRVEPHPAEWQDCRRDGPVPCPPNPYHRRRRSDGNTFCPLAGPRRNQDMVDRSADVCLAFFKEGAGNRGTKDCVNRAEAAGVCVHPTVQRVPTFRQAFEGGWS